MQKNLKTISVAIPHRQFRQILDYLDTTNGNGANDGTVASFLRQAITDFLSQQGYEQVQATFATRQGRPARRR